MNDENQVNVPLETFKRLVEEEERLHDVVRQVSRKTMMDYISERVPLPPLLERAFADPVHALDEFFEKHTSPLRDGMIEFDELVLPKGRVALAVAAVFEYAKMVHDNFNTPSLDKRFKNQAPIPVLWGHEGTGKTTFALSLSRVLRGETIFMNMGTITEPEEVVGEMNAAKLYARSQQLSFLLSLASSGKVAEKDTSSVMSYDLSFDNPALWDLAPLIVGAVSGISVTGDEIGRMTKRALDGMMQANVATYTFGGRIIQARPGHFLLCTANPKKEGDRHFTTDVPQQRRFLLIDFDYDLPFETFACRISGKKAASALKAAFEHAKKKGIKLSPRQLIYISKLSKYADASGDTSEYIAGLLGGMMSSEER